MVCFVLFQGGGAQLSDWEPLVTELKKLGTVYQYQNLAYNVFSYLGQSKTADKNLSFNMQYLNMDKHIDMVYKQVSHHKHLIPVAWSAGGYFARAFAQKYPCDRMILIDPVMIEYNNILARYKKIYSDFKKHSIHTNKYLQQIITNVKTKHDLPSAIKMMDFVHSMWTKYAMDKIKPSKIPVLIFYNYKGKKKNGEFSDVCINREIKYLHEHEPAIIKTCVGVGHNIFYYNTKWLMNIALNYTTT